MVCVDNTFVQHLLKRAQRFGSLNLRTGGEGWTAISVSSGALCDGDARNKDKHEVVHNPTTHSGPTAKI
jgi:hypothetical protein